MRTAYVGNGIQAVRKEAHMTQQELADKLGIQRTLLSFYENGRALPDYCTVQQIAEILGCTVGDLYRPAILELIRKAS